MRGEETTTRWARWAALGVLGSLLLTSGCTVVKGKTHADLSPFADYTAAMMSELDFEFERDIHLYTRWMWDWEEPKIVELMALHARVYNLAEAVVEYSYEVVVLAEDDDLEGPAKVHAYTEFLQEFSPLENAIGGIEFPVTRDEKQQIIAEITTEEELLGALMGAQPLIYGLLQYSQELMYRIGELQLELELYFSDRIDARFAAVTRAEGLLLAEKGEVLDALGLAWEARRGGDDDLVRLRQHPVVEEVAGADDDLAAIDGVLAARLAELSGRLQDLAPQLESHVRNHRELDATVAFHAAELRQMRRVIFAWCMAHQRMANGVTDPGELFKIIGAGKAVYDLKP
jgi:hypothetical protein